MTDERDDSKGPGADGAPAAGSRPDGGAERQGDARPARTVLSAQNIKVTPRQSPSIEVPPPTQASPTQPDEPASANQPAGPAQTGEDRRAAAAMRRRTLLSAKVIFNASQTVIDCMVRDMSQTGAKLVFQATPNCPKLFDLVLSSGTVRRCEVVYRRETTLGVRFLGVDAG